MAQETNLLKQTKGGANLHKATNSSSRQINSYRLSGLHRENFSCLCESPSSRGISTWIRVVSVAPGKIFPPVVYIGREVDSFSPNLLCSPRVVQLHSTNINGGNQRRNAIQATSPSLGAPPTLGGRFTPAIISRSQSCIGFRWTPVPIN